MKKFIYYTSLLIVITYIVYFSLIIYDVGSWEYGGCVILEKVQQMSQGKPLYPHVIGLNEPVYTWPYMPLSAVIYEYYYLLFHGNIKLLTFASFIMFVMTGVITGIIASKIAGKNIILPTLAMFLTPIFITKMGSVPRVDTVALFFLSLSILEHEHKHDKMSTIYFLLAFLSKQTYIFSLPFLYIYEKKFKNFAVLISALLLCLLILLVVSTGFYENVILFTRSQTIDNLAKIYDYINFTLSMYFVTGMLVMFIISLQTRKKNYLYLFILLSLIASVMMMKSGSSVNYYYQPLFVLSIIAGDALAKIKRPKIILSTILILFILQLALSSVPYRVNVLKTIDRIVTGNVFSDDACIDSNHYDWFFLNQYGKKGLWSWNKVSMSIALHKYDYIVLYNQTYAGYVAQRIDSNIYTIITQKYDTYTTVVDKVNTVVIYTPKRG